MRSRALRLYLDCLFESRCPRCPGRCTSTTLSSGGAPWPRSSHGLPPSPGTFFSVMFLASLMGPLYYIRAYLAIPATSAPVERLFSVAGNVISAKRARLTDGAASDLIVLHQSWATCAAKLPGFVQSHLPESERTPSKRARPSLPLGA